MKKLLIALAALAAFPVFSQVTELPDKEGDKTKTEIIVENIVPVPSVTVNPTVTPPDVNVSVEANGECREIASFHSFVEAGGAEGIQVGLRPFIITDVVAEHINIGANVNASSVMLLQADGNRIFSQSASGPMAVGESRFVQTHFNSGIPANAYGNIEVVVSSLSIHQMIFTISGYYIGCGD